MAETPSGEKKSSKILILIVGALLLLLAGGAGGYFFFMHQASQDDQQSEHGDAKAHDKKGEEAKHDEHAEDAKHEEVAEPDVYYEIPSPFLVNFPPGSSAKVIKINIVLLMKGDSSVAMLKKHEPMIRNNLLMAISTLGADKAKTREGKEALKALMLSEIGKVLEKMAGKNTAKDLYFTEFVMQ